MGTSKKNLLVADDDLLVQATYKHCFERAGYSVGLANDGSEAIAYLRDHDVETVFLDIFMPDKDGLETLLEIKKAFPKVRVIAMTGGGIRARYDFLATASKFGADGLVRKPISPDALIKMLETSNFPPVLA